MFMDVSPREEIVFALCREGPYELWMLLATEHRLLRHGPQLPVGQVKARLCLPGEKPGLRGAGADGVHRDRHCTHGSTGRDANPMKHVRVPHRTGEISVSFESPRHRIDFGRPRIALLHRYCNPP